MIRLSGAKPMTIQRSLEKHRFTEALIESLKSFSSPRNPKICGSNPFILFCTKQPKVTPFTKSQHPSRNNFPSCSLHEVVLLPTTISFAIRQLCSRGADAKLCLFLLLYLTFSVGWEWGCEQFNQKRNVICSFHILSPLTYG